MHLVLEHLSTLHNDPMQVKVHCKQVYHIPPPALGALMCDGAVVLSHGRHGTGAGWLDTLIIMGAEEAAEFAFLCGASRGGRGRAPGYAHSLACKVSSTTERLAKGITTKELNLGLYGYNLELFCRVSQGTRKQ